MIVRLALLAAALLALAAPGAGLAQSNPAFIPLGPVAKGVVYRPDAGPPPHVGVLVIHRTANFLVHPACTQLAARGFTVLCVNSRYDNNDTLLRFEDVALDVKAGVEWLRRQPGITKVLLFGHSGGGSTLAFYQAVAENGVAYCQDPARLTKCGNDLAGLPKADGLIFADAHPGEPMQVLRGLNPSFITDPQTGETRVDPALDPFSPANGYNPDGPSHFPPEFQARYYAAQAAEMNALIAKAQAGLARKGLFGDDGVLTIRGGGNPGSGDAGRAFLFVMDPGIAAIGSTARPEKLLRNDGSVMTEMLHSVKAADPKIAADNRTFDRGTKVYTYRAFLSSDAMRATNLIDGIDFCSSNNSAGCAVPVISVPLLIMAMGANDFLREDEKMFDAAKSADKDYIVIEGALHGFAPCTACETAPGQYSNTVKNMFDYTAAWIDKRY